MESAWDKTDRRKKMVQVPALTETAAGAIAVSSASEQTEDIEEEDHLEVRLWRRALVCNKNGGFVADLGPFPSREAYLGQPFAS